MDHYKLLGVKETATKEEVTRAYRKLALKYHPDKNHALNAEEKMSALNEAYKVLQDDKRRDDYDRFDLPQTRSRESHSQSRHHQSSHRRRYDDRFFTGSSESHSAEQRYKSTLDEIQRINEDLLTAFNAQRRRRHQPSSHSRRAGRSGRFEGQIMPDKTDDEYERIVLDRLRALGRQ